MRCPGNIVESLERYIFHRTETGGFLRAVLQNDLQSSFERADSNNRERMLGIVGFVSCAIPGYFRGNHGNVQRWLDMEETPEWFDEEYKRELHQRMAHYEEMDF